MHGAEDETASLYQALDIAMNYLVQRGYGLLEANEKAGAHVVRLFNTGEHRPLVLANLAIAAIEKEEQIERERHTISVFPIFGFSPR